MTTIRRMGQTAATDRAITPDEAKAIVAQAEKNGIVSKTEKADLQRIMTEYKDLFQAGALDVIKALVEPTPPPQPPSGGQTINLDPAGGNRPVFLNASGVFTAAADGKAPANNVELGDALFKAGEVADNAREPMLANVTPELQAKTFDQLKLALARVPSDGAPPAGLDANQALQLRGSAASVLLDLVNAAKTPALQQSALGTYEALVRAEKNPRLRESMIFHLVNSKAAQTGEPKKIADALLKELAPTSPPYDKWFANGKNTVNLSWTVGQGEFWGGFTKYLKDHGFKPVGAENQYGVSTYEATINKPGVGETKFRISVREGGTNILAPMNDPNVQIVGYDGHSNWGRAMSSSVNNGPATTDGAADKLLFYNLCVGKGMLDKVKEKYGNAQVVTTYAASNFYTDNNGQMTRGEGVQALMALVDGVAGRKGWTDIHQGMNDAADIGWGRTWDNYITPISTMTREKVLDRDNDGQADYLDKHFNYSTFKVPEDTRREFEPVKQDRHASVLDGTKVLVSANMVNTLSEFSGILDRANPDSKVIAGGWFEPKMGEKDLIRFTEQKGRDGKTEYVMSVSSRYSHLSEEALRAITVFEFNRFLGDKGLLRMPAEDVKLAGLLAFGQSLAVDEGYRDNEVWSTFIKRYNLPASINLSMVTQALGAHTGHNYAGDAATVAKLKELIGPAAVAELKKPEVGQPVTVV
ncbi:MAG: hypothetical protein GQE15_27720 [Archangiaceae bacterium]|nr:hypothetical protein [Archangiaceae bacterium]